MVGRPRRWRRVSSEARSDYYKPAGIPLVELEEVILSPEELEALRLTELEQQGQAEAADAMGISQPTLNRDLKSARKKIADALLNGKAIRLTKRDEKNNGGETMPNRDGTGPLGKGPRTGRGLGPCGPARDEETVPPRLGRGRRARGTGQGVGRGRRW